MTYPPFNRRVPGGLLLLLWLLLLPALTGRTAQVQLAVDSANSSLRLQLCADPGLGQDCDEQTRPLTGFLRVGLDHQGNPSQIAMRDFDLQAVGNYDLQLRWAFGLAGVDATASNIRIYHSRPGPANPFVPVAGGAYTFLAVPFLASGNADYDLTGLACSVVSVPCSSNINLASLGENTIDTLGGTLQVSGGVLILNLDFTFSTLLDTANPALGTLNGRAIVRATAPVNLGLVPPGSFWRYHDTGLDLGGLWSLPAGFFDDSSWPVGEAQLGYGDGDEVTVVSFGPDAGNKYPTTYFRHTFNVTDAGAYTNLALRVLADDGVVLYLNGSEVYRAGMPPGTPAFATLATTTVSGAAENVYFLAVPAPSASLLVNGANVLAAEVHQSAGNSSDLSFDLELAGNTVFSNAPPAVLITSPTNGALLPEGTLAIQVSATDTDGLVTRVALYEGVTLVGELATPPYNFTRPGLCAGTYSFTARAYDDSGAEGVSPTVVVTVARPPVTLVNTGAVWRFLDNGSDQGTAWRGRTFNDAGWASGAAQLGFGDGDEITLVNGGPSTNRFITTYFRHTFNVTNTQAMGSLNLRLLRDDGAIVYLNGTEVFRNNMPAGTVAFQTLASTNAGGADETVNFFTATVNAAALTNGANVLAVEVHQGSTTSSDLSFDLSASANITNLPPSSVTLVQPVPESVFPLGAPVTMQAAAVDGDGFVARVEYYSGTNRIGQAMAAPFTLQWSNAPAGYHQLTARAVDGCGAASVSAAVPVRIGAFTMVPAGATWRYLDNGTDQGTAWRTPGFNDAAWASGPAQFGYGEGDEATVLNSGPTAGRYITTYFRRPLVIPNPEVVTGLVVRLLRDDGAVVYLNGMELFRSNMPTGAVNHLTPAPVAVGGADETTFFVTALPAPSLNPGTNLLAVEIHQQSGTSSDVSFDLELIGLVAPHASQLEIQAGTSSVTLRWPSAAAGLRLQQSPDPALPASWQYVAGTPSDNGAWKQITLSATGAARFFRLAP